VPDPVLRYRPTDRLYLTPTGAPNRRQDPEKTGRRKRASGMHKEWFGNES